MVFILVLVLLSPSQGRSHSVTFSVLLKPLTCRDNSTDRNDDSRWSTGFQGGADRAVPACWSPAAGSLGRRCWLLAAGGCWGLGLSAAGRCGGLLGPVSGLLVTQLARWLGLGVGGWRSAVGGRVFGAGGRRFGVAVWGWVVSSFPSVLSFLGDQLLLGWLVAGSLDTTLDTPT